MRFGLRVMRRGLRLHRIGLRLRCREWASVRREAEGKNYAEVRHVQRLTDDT